MANETEQDLDPRGKRYGGDLVQVAPGWWAPVGDVRRDLTHYREELERVHRGEPLGWVYYDEHGDEFELEDLGWIEYFEGEVRACERTLRRYARSCCFSQRSRRPPPPMPRRRQACGRRRPRTARRRASGLRSGQDPGDGDGDPDPDDEHAVVLLEEAA
jgi:hypothetical protein